MAPPNIILSLCSSMLPPNFSKEMAVAQSSILNMHDVVMHWHQTCRAMGLWKGLWKAVTLRSVMVLCESANWIRLIPSMLMFGQHTRASAFSLLLTAFIGGRPTRMDGLTPWFFLLLGICAVDWAVNEFPRVRRVWTRGSKQRLSVVRYLAVEFLFALGVAPFIALSVCLSMIVVVQGVTVAFGG